MGSSVSRQEAKTAVAPYLESAGSESASLADFVHRMQLEKPLPQRNAELSLDLLRAACCLELDCTGMWVDFGKDSPMFLVAKPLFKSSSPCFPRNSTSV